MGMDDVVSVAFFGPVDHIVGRFFRGKPESGAGDPRDIVRMGVPVHVMVHQVIGFLPFVAEQPAEAFGKHEGGHPLIDELVNGIRNGGTFHIFLYSFIVLISFHAVAPFPRIIPCNLKTDSYQYYMLIILHYDYIKSSSLLSIYML